MITNTAPPLHQNPWQMSHKFHNLGLKPYSHSFVFVRCLKLVQKKFKSFKIGRFFLSRFLGAKKEESMNFSILMLQLFSFIGYKEKVKICWKVEYAWHTKQGGGAIKVINVTKKHYQNSMDKYMPINDRSLGVILHHSLL